MSNDKYYVVDTKKTNKQPFSDLHHIIQALESMRTINGVINTHLTNLMKWNYQENDNNISNIVNQLLRTLNNTHSQEHDFKIKNSINDVLKFLPKKPFKDLKPTE